MKPTVTVYLQPETMTALDGVPAGTVNARSARLGLYEGEPLLVIADALLSYAKAYKARFDGPVFKDGVSGDAFLEMTRGLKVFLDFDGGVALRRGITTDSKDNLSILHVIEAICKEAGIDYEEL